MGRTKEKQKRVGKKEDKQIRKLLKKIDNYKIFVDMKKDRETKFNARLMDHIKQGQDSLEVTNKNIPSAEFVGETFRPEFYLGKVAHKTCAVECKRLIDKNAKTKWKEGLSQALLYSEVYKAVILVFFDYTKKSNYYEHFGRGNSIESRFRKKMRDNNIHILLLKPV
ncbi:hypothetical protein HYS31_06130 [Candidatus Woesearchaeota archaeon]|nr:hypothetical protein [Candidatus Woesearchaeota archaeon]